MGSGRSCRGSEGSALSYRASYGEGKGCSFAEGIVDNHHMIVNEQQIKDHWRLSKKSWPGRWKHEGYNCQRKGPGKTEMRSAYCSSLIRLAQKDDRVVVLDADLMKSMGMVPFMEAFPDRAFDVGIQEANMMGVAAGLSAAGMIPYAHSFAPFATRRCFDQVFLSCGYARLNVRIAGSDPGVTAAYNGGTHMPFEDMGILRNVPDITILEPVDSVMLSNLVEQTLEPYGSLHPAS